MIFATVGTHHQPFTRLMHALDQLPAEELVVQHGHSPRPRHAAEAVPFLPFADLLDHMERARVVITHAGSGSILLSRRFGHSPIVVPRLARHGEHVDDHQLELARVMEGEGSVTVLWEMDRLAEAVAGVPPRGERQAAHGGALHAAVRAALERAS